MKEVSPSSGEYESSVSSLWAYVCMCVNVVCVVYAHRLTHTHAQFRGLGIVIGMESTEWAESCQMAGCRRMTGVGKKTFHTVKGYPREPHGKCSKGAVSMLAEVLTEKEVLLGWNFSWRWTHSVYPNSNSSTSTCHLELHLSPISYQRDKHLSFLGPKSWASSPRSSLHSISSPLKCFLDSLFSCPCLGIYLAGLPNSGSSLFLFEI